MKKSRNCRRRGLSSRITAVILLLLLGMQLLPMEAQADEESGVVEWKTMVNSGKASQGKALYFLRLYNRCERAAVRYPYSWGE